MGNMKFYKHLYVSEDIGKKKEKIIRNMKSGKYPLTTYLLVLIEEGENQLEFYSASLLRQGMLYEEDIFVVGLASGYEDAVYLVEEIIREVMKRPAMWIYVPILGTRKRNNIAWGNRKRCSISSD